MNPSQQSETVRQRRAPTTSTKSLSFKPLSLRPYRVNGLRSACIGLLRATVIHLFAVRTIRRFNAARKAFDLPRSTARTEQKRIPVARGDRRRVARIANGIVLVQDRRTGHNIANNIDRFNHELSSCGNNNVRQIDRVYFITRI